MNKHNQRGITLVVSLIMLIVLTLLVVSAIRFGNINLRIASNAQVEAESSAATQLALEKTLVMVNAASRPSDVAAQSQVVISTGGSSYKVDIAQPACVFSRNVLTSELDPTRPSDTPCIEGDPDVVIFDSTGRPIPQPTACKDQQWDVAAKVGDAGSGAKVTILQGVAMRVSAEVACS